MDDQEQGRELVRPWEECDGIVAKHSYKFTIGTLGYIYSQRPTRDRNIHLDQEKAAEILRRAREGDIFCQRAIAECARRKMVNG